MICETIADKDRLIAEVEVVSTKQTEAGFVIGVKIKSCIQYCFSEDYIEPGTTVNIDQELQLFQR